MSWSESSLKCYPCSEYGVNTQKTVATLGKELLRAARFSNSNQFNLWGYKWGIVPTKGTCDSQGSKNPGAQADFATNGRSFATKKFRLRLNQDDNENDCMGVRFRIVFRGNAGQRLDEDDGPVLTR